MDDPDEIKALKDFDVNLQQFYYDVIGKEVDLKMKWKAHSIRRALSEVVKAYKKRPRRKSDIRFDTPYRRCAYLLKHSPCFTSAVAKYFYKLVSHHDDLMEHVFKSGRLSICCLGGGPATDAVAVLHIIRYLYQPYWIKDHKILQVNITVVDISEEWKDTAKNVLDCLQDAPVFFGNGEMALTYDFLTADLTTDMDKQLQMIIKSADIVTMIYFLSAVTGTRGRKTSEEMVEKIMLQMKKGAFVFFLDSAVDKHYEILNTASEKRNVMQEIYGPLVEEFHTMSIASVQCFLDLYSQHFHRLIGMTHMFFCVSSWKKPLIKEPKNRIRREILGEKPPSWKKPTDEESDDLTQKMKQYRSTVYRLMNKKYDSLNSKSSYGFNRQNFSRSCGNINVDKRKTDSINNRNFANQRYLGKSDLTDSSINNRDLEFKNFRKTDTERKSFSPNNSDFASVSYSNQSVSKNGRRTLIHNQSGIQSLRTVGASA